MSWDLATNANGDLSGGIATGSQEVAQRVKGRLHREYGTWFLNEQSGVPWYFDGKGILGMTMGNKPMVESFLRQIVLDTEGVARIKQLTTIFDNNNRLFSLYFELVTDFGDTVSGTLALE